MRLTSLRIFCNLNILLCLFAVSVAGQAELSAKEIARKALPSVALIICTGTSEASQGTGFFIKAGVLVTNYHVIEKMNRGIVQVIANDGQTARYFRIARIISVDKDADLALLSVPGAKSENLPSLDLAAESYRVEVGETVYALGNPEGLVGTISPGIVSANPRSSKKQTTIQITAPISHGSSGGPVVNAFGDVIGIAVGTISEGQNLNFAIPVSFLRSLIGGASFPDDKQDKLDTLGDVGSKIPRPWATQTGTLPTELNRKQVGGELSATDYYIRGIANYRDKLYDKAIEDFTAAIRSDPGFASAYYNRGVVYGKRKLTGLAIADYSKAIELRPGDASTHFNRGNQYAAQGDRTKAIADFSSAIKLNPSDSSGYHNRGYMFQLTKDYPRAIEDYTVAISLNPNSIDSYGGRGIVYGRLGSLDLLLRDFNKIVELEPQDPLGYIGRAVYYCKTGDSSGAKAEEKKVVALGGTVPNPCQ